MADVIPLERLPFKDCEFTPISPTSSSRMDGRRTETQSFGTPYWTVRYTTEWMTPKQYGLFDSFIMKADARGTPFLAYDVFRPRPIAMDQGAPLSGTKAGGGAFTGDVAFSAVTATTLSITGLPAGFVFSPGDYIEVRKSALVRSLHRIVESATANSSGAVTVTIMYQLDTQNFNASCTGHLEKPSCVMMIDPGSVQSPKSWGTREGSFAATEVFFS